MKIELSENSAPVIKLTRGELENSSSTLVGTVEIESETGEIARFWVHAAYANGRPTLQVATKVGKDRAKQVTKSVTGTCNII